MLKFWIAILLTSSVLFGCNADRNTGGGGQPDPADPLTSTTKTYEFSGPNCAVDSNQCLEVKVRYPVFAGTGADRLNAAIEDRLLYNIAFFADPEEAREELTLQRAVDSINAMHQLSLADVDAFTNRWSLDTEGEVAYQSGRVVAVTLNNYSYMGGAHPNAFVDFINFDRKQDDAIIEPADLYQDTVALQAVIEQKIRTLRKLPPDADLEEAGYFWDGDFVFPSNFLITEKGLELVYNPYEIAAYAVGFTELFIPKAELTGLVRTEYWE